MKTEWKPMLLAAVFGLCLPAALLLMQWEKSPPEKPAVPTETAPQMPTETIARVETPARTLLVKGKDGLVTELPLEEYLLGVVCAEMPGSFHPEALKAQAVVARTYALKRIGRSKHTDCDICTDSACCQGWADISSVTDGETADKLRSAVEETAGMVLTYNGALIDATYFSCSGGSTEAAVAVWGSDVPYLQATSSPGEENAAHFEDTVTFSAGDFAEKMGISGEGNPADWFGVTSYTEGGGVKSMEIRGQQFSGTTLRKLLGLRSTWFELFVQDNCITVVTHGFGHRVGMSQYGADAMARNGADYETILKHYYQGVELEER